MGGEYPVAATSAAERAEASSTLVNRRGETVVMVFSMQVQYIVLCVLLQAQLFCLMTRMSTKLQLMQVTYVHSTQPRKIRDGSIYVIVLIHEPKKQVAHIATCMLIIYLITSVAALLLKGLFATVSRHDDCVHPVVTDGLKQCQLHILCAT